MIEALPVHRASHDAFRQEDPLFAQFLLETGRVVIVDKIGKVCETSDNGNNNQK